MKVYLKAPSKMMYNVDFVNFVFRLSKMIKQFCVFSASDENSNTALTTNEVSLQMLYRREVGIQKDIGIKFLLAIENFLMDNIIMSIFEKKKKKLLIYILNCIKENLSNTLTVCQFLCYNIDDGYCDHCFI